MLTLGLFAWLSERFNKMDKTTKTMLILSAVMGAGYLYYIKKKGTTLSNVVSADLTVEEKIPPKDKVEVTAQKVVPQISSDSYTKDEMTTVNTPQLTSSDSYTADEIATVNQGKSSSWFNGLPRTV
jgi:hypothetical protein